MHSLTQQLTTRIVTTLTRDDGQTMAEYGVVLALITLAVVGVMAALGLAIDGKMTGVWQALTGSSGTP